MNQLTKAFVRLAIAVTIAGAALAGCSNSILRNFGEAGVETIRDEPLPTPTAVPHRIRADARAR